MVVKKKKIFLESLENILVKTKQTSKQKQKYGKRRQGVNTTSIA